MIALRILAHLAWLLDWETGHECPRRRPASGASHNPELDGTS